jgi:hypothetical protein
MAFDNIYHLMEYQSATLRIIQPQQMPILVIAAVAGI